MAVARGARPCLMADAQPSPAPPQQPAPAPKRKGYKRWLRGKNSWFAKFARQELPGWTPILSARFVVFAYLLAAVVLLPLGIAVLVASVGIQEHKVNSASFNLINRRI